MSGRTRAQSRAFLLLCLLLLFLAGVYYRVANPSLSYHLGHAPTPALSASADPAHDHPPLPPEANAELARLMGQLQQNPSDLARLLAIADLFTRHKDWVNALAFLDRAARTAPSDMRPAYFRGVTLAAKHDYAGAAVAFERALEMAPGNDFVRYNLAVLYRHHLGEPGKAAELFRAITVSPGASEALKARARAELG